MIYPEEKDIILARKRGMSYAAINREYGYDRRLISEVANIWGFPVDVSQATIEANRKNGRAREKPVEWYICKNCNKKYPRNKKMQGEDGKTFCSRECAVEYKRKKSKIGKYIEIYITRCEICNEWIVSTRKKKLCSKRDCELIYGRNKYYEMAEETNKKKRDEYIPKPKVMGICVVCGRVFWKTKGGVYCSRACIKWIGRQKHRALMNDAYKEDVLFKIVYRRDRGICQICGRHTHKRYNNKDKLSATLDHIIALDNGGDHSYDNIQLACMYCNSKKGNRKTWLQMQLVGIL